MSSATSVPRGVDAVRSWPAGATFRTSRPMRSSRSRSRSPSPIPWVERNPYEEADTKQILALKLKLLDVDAENLKLKKKVRELKKLCTNSVVIKQMSGMLNMLTDVRERALMAEDEEEAAENEVEEKKEVEEETQAGDEGVPMSPLEEEKDES